MPLVSSTIPSLVNGVSQQPDTLRLTSQCSLLDNAYSTIVKGVNKRPPFRHLAKVFPTPTHATDYVHTINRSVTERYGVFIANGSVSVFSLLDGSPRTVTYPAGTSYLATSVPNQTFVALTVADYTFIVNKNVAVARTSVLSPVRLKEAIIHVKQGSYGCTYTVNISGAVSASGTFTTNNGAVATDSTTITTTNIASKLYASLLTGIGSVLNITLQGSLIYIQAKTAGQDFQVVCSDGLGDTALVGIKDTTQFFTDLPAEGVNGFQVKIVGDASTSFDDYYVAYTSAQMGSVDGFWTETTAQGVANNLDPMTMPWQLVRQSDGTFTCGPATWTARVSGDDTSNEPPSFVGQTIADVFFHRNRLGFLAGQNIILSKASFYFDFWLDSVTQLLDSDYIDVAANHTKVSTLRAAATYADNLLLFSDQTQFVLSGGDLLTPKSVSVKPNTEYENNALVCKPVSTGRNIYFTQARNAFTAIREYSTLPISQINDAPEATSQVPQYIPAGVFKIAYTATEDCLAILSTHQPNVIFVYKYFWNGDSKAQSCWSTWTLDPGDTILNLEFVQSALYATIQRADGVYLEMAQVELGCTDNGFQYQIALDRLVFPQGTYNAGTNTTTWFVPYDMTTGGTYQIVLGAGFSSPSLAGSLLTVNGTLPQALNAVGNYSAAPVYIGRQYTTRMRLSKLIPHEHGLQLGSVQTNTEARLQLNRISVSYEGSGLFRAEVTPYARQLGTYYSTGFILADALSTVGGRPTPTGTFRFPVISDASTVQIDLVNDSYLPSSFQQFSYEGKMYLRSTRI